jgi:transcriptional regulator with AAA-type ATPase domain
MKDLNINIGGPRDQARQNVSFHVHQAGDRTGLDGGQLSAVLESFRAAIERSGMSADDARRIERHLANIEEESAAPQPLLDEIMGSFNSVERLVQSLQAVAPALVAPMRLLASSLGMTVGW